MKNVLTPKKCKSLLCVRAPYDLYRVNETYAVVSTSRSRDAEFSVRVKITGEDGDVYSFHDVDIDKSKEFMDEHPSYFFFIDISDMSGEDLFHLKLTL